MIASKATHRSRPHSRPECDRVTSLSGRLKVKYFVVAPSNHQYRVTPLIARWRHHWNEQNELKCIHNMAIGKGSSIIVIIFTSVHSVRWGGGRGSRAIVRFFKCRLTRFNKIAIQGTPQMAVDKEAISLSRVYLNTILSVPAVILCVTRLN